MHIRAKSGASEQKRKGKSPMQHPFFSDCPDLNRETTSVPHGRRFAQTEPVKDQTTNKKERKTEKTMENQRTKEIN